MIYSEEDCTDTMTYNVLVGDPYFDDTPVMDRIKGGCPKDHQWLSEQDREILIEYAPRLFNTLPVKYDLTESMAKLAGLLGKHRFESMWKRSEKIRMSAHKLNKKTPEEKAEAVRGHIESLLGILYGNYGEIPMETFPKMQILEDDPMYEYRTSKDDLLDELLKAHEDPLRYLPQGWATAYEMNEAGEIEKAPHHTLSPISEYLVLLSLPNRSDIIKEFNRKISAQNWFATFLVKQQRPPLY